MSIMPEFTVIIPARLSSVRLPEKALADIAGKPMVVRTAQAAQKSAAQRVAVATDDKRIQVACQAHHIECVMTNANHQSGTDRLAEASTLLGLPENGLVVNVQGDEPLIDANIINLLANHLNHSESPMATAAHNIETLEEFNNPNVVKVVLNQHNNALYFSRAPIPLARDHSGSLNHSALRHIGIYAYRVPFLTRYHTLAQTDLEKTESLEQLRVLWHGYTISVLTLNHIPAAGVDTAEDLARVRAYFEKNKHCETTDV